MAKNAFWNIAGQGLPMLLALFAIPLLLQDLGTEAFGVLILVWVVVGYSSLFDFGLGRTLTKLVSEKLGAGRDAEIPVLVWTGLALMLLFGAGLGLLLCAAAPWLVKAVLQVGAPLQEESLQTFYLLGGAIPLIVVTAGLIGAISSLQRFDLINAIKIPQGVFNFLAPVLVLPFSKSLFVITAVLVFGRVIVGAGYLFITLRLFPAMAKKPELSWSVLKPLLRFGVWMMVSNIISPLMVYLDRFIIGAVLSLSAVAYYATPYEMVTKLLIVPGAVVGVLFPAFATLYAQGPEKTVPLFIRGSKYVLLLLLPVCLLLVAFSRELLDIWLGDEFAQQSTQVMQFLTIGVFVNALAHVAFVLVQGGGRPDITAKLHLLEFPLYMLLLWYALGAYGVNGAAIAWSARVFVDMVLLFYVATKLLDMEVRLRVRMGAALLGSLLMFAFALLSFPLWQKAVLIALLLLVYLAAGWSLVLSRQERSFLAGKLKAYNVQ